MYSVLSEEAVRWRLIALAFGFNIILSTSRLVAMGGRRKGGLHPQLLADNYVMNIT